MAVMRHRSLLEMLAPLRMEAVVFSFLAQTSEMKCFHSSQLVLGREIDLGRMVVVACFVLEGWSYIGM